MEDNRFALPVGTLVQIPSGNLYRITGSPLGSGGSGILYPAERLVESAGQLRRFGTEYALKECYPLSGCFGFLRDPETGEIRPAEDTEQSRAWLDRAKEALIRESETAQNIFRTTGRVLPVLDHGRSVVLTLPGKAPVAVANTVTVTDSLRTKGRSLRQLMEAYGSMTALEAFRLLQQVLFALRDIHRAGYLHLDLQDGNLFVEGSLGEGDELLHMIDFGSSRPMTDGKTAPIEDRVIFKSPGFTAPEILKENDGTLTLGPEADLFSACCLLLYLLTGRRRDLHRLIFRRTGTYLGTVQAMRMKCPLHLVGRIQRFLAKGLAPDPGERFPSADAMLTEVSDILTELQPKKAKKSSAAYDAFLCYQHNPVDSAAAKALQAALENFRTPPGYPNLPRRPFRKVFLDEGELASCADLGKKIEEALANSAQLLVVCSPETPKSPWVHKEIETFIRLHQDSSRILAVMTDGTPETSFPFLLRQEQLGRDLFAPFVTGKTPEEKAKTIRTETVLKVAVPMLHLDSYDDLRQRHLTRLLKRAAAGVGVVVLVLAGFAAYAVNRANVISWQAQRIQEEYTASLRNESLFLAQQARERLEEKDPSGALELLLQALPSQEQQRPVVPQAEYLLGETLGIYRNPSNAEGTVTAVGVIPVKNSRFFPDETGAYLFSWDVYADMFQVWDTGTRTVLWELPAEQDPVQNIYGEYFEILSMVQTPENDRFYTDRDFLLEEDHALLLRCGSRLLSLDYQKGNENWAVSLENLVTFELSEDKTKLAVVHGAQGARRVEESDDQPVAMTLELLDAKTGRSLGKTAFELAPGYCVSEGLRISSDAKWAAIPTVLEKTLNLYEAPQRAIWVLDLTTGEMHLLWEGRWNLVAMEFDRDLLALTRYDKFSITWQTGERVETEAPRSCIRTEVYGGSDWQLQFSAEQVGYCWEGSCNGIRPLVLEGQEVLLVYGQDRCLLLDRNSGEILREYTLPAELVWLDSDQEGFRAVCRDGSVVSGTFAEETLRSMPWFAAPISGAFRTGNTCYIQNSPDFDPDYTVRVFQAEIWDEQYTLLADLQEPGWAVFTDINTETGGQVILTKESRLCILDRNSGAVQYHDLPDFDAEHIQGLSEDKKKLYWTFQPDDSSAYWLGQRHYCLDLSTGQVTTQEPPPVENTELLLFQDPVYWKDGYYILTMRFADGEQNRLTLWYWSLGDNTLETVCQTRLEGELDVCHPDSLQVSPDGERIWFASAPFMNSRGNRVFCLDRASGVLAQISTQFLPETDRDDFVSLLTGNSAWMPDCYLWNSRGDLAVVGFGDTVYVLTETGEIQCRIPVEEPIVEGCFLPDGESLLLISEKAEVSRWRIADGECLERISLSRYDSREVSLGRKEIRILFPEEMTLELYTPNNGFLLDLSGSGLVMKTRIPHCFGYDPEEDRYLVAESSYSEKDTTLGSFPRYHLETMVEMARDRLG